MSHKERAAALKKDIKAVFLEIKEKEKKIIEKIEEGIKVEYER